jgi:hypothetical protein
LAHFELDVDGRSLPDEEADIVQDDLLEPGSLGRYVVNAGWQIRNGVLTRLICDGVSRESRSSGNDVHRHRRNDGSGGIDDCSFHTAAAELRCGSRIRLKQQGSKYDQGGSSKKEKGGDTLRLEHWSLSFAKIHHR